MLNVVKVTPILLVLVVHFCYAWNSTLPGYYGELQTVNQQKLINKKLVTKTN